MSVTPLALLLCVAMFFAHWKFVILWLDGDGALKWVWGSSNPVALLSWVRVTFIAAQVSGLALAFDSLRWPAGIAAMFLFALHYGLLYALSELPARDRRRHVKQ
jgi:hypothetical protein